MTWAVCSYTVADNTFDTPEPNASSQAASRVLENLAELEPELKGAAIVDGSGRTIATTGSAGQWGGKLEELLAAVDEVRERDVDSAHLATDLAEIFVVREAGLTLVAVTARFVLASLTSFDMRMALRDAAKGAESA